MSDIMIPGVTNSGFDTDGMLEEIMDAERAPVNRMEERVDTYKEEQEAWQEIGRKISNLQEAARLLFGFENPFNDRIASSSDESALTAVADRNAPEGVTDVKVIQIAQADRFISRSLPEDFRVARGRYGFRVGETEEFFTFAGGTLESFAQAVNQRAGDIVSARVVRNTANTKVILIESLLTGSENVLSFLEDARAFALEAGILEEVRDQTMTAPIQASTVTGWTRSASAAGMSVQSGTLTVEPGGEASLRFPATVDTDGAWVLEFEVDVRNFYTGWTPPPTPPGPDVPDAGSITLGDVTVENAPSEVPLPDWEPPEPPVVRDDLGLLFLQSGQSIVPLPKLEDTDGFTTVQIPLAEYAATVNALNIRNNNTHREVRIRNVAVFDPRSRGDVAPVNPIGTAGDSIVEVDGIRVIRPTNTIDDLLDRVTLNLRSVTPRPVEITVEPDTDGVTDSLINFVFYYNELVREINILTRNEQAIIDEILNFTEEERTSAEERLGMLQGDLTLNTLKNRLQTVMMNPYPTRAGSNLVLLAQMGISTNASGPGGGFDASRLRGYLEMNPREVEGALRSYFLAVRELFGTDTDGDAAIDSGVAYEIDRLTRPYVQVGGIVASRTGTISSSIARTEDRIERENARLERVEAQYRADFAQMEGALNSLEENQRTLENLQTQTGGGQ